MERHDSSSSLLPAIKVLLMHADPLLALGLAAALQQQRDVQLCGSALERADVVIADYPTGRQLAAGRRRGMDGEARILVVTMQDREQEVRAALEGGVHGYVLLGASVDELLQGVRSLAQGGRYLSQAVVQRMADSLTREALTARETDVLRLLARGDCNKSIARELDIAVGTVKAHVKGILNKLEASCRTQAASIAAQRGLVAAAAVTARRPQPRRAQSAVPAYA